MERRGSGPRVPSLHPRGRECAAELARVGREPRPSRLFRGATSHIRYVGCKDIATVILSLLWRCCATSRASPAKPRSPPPQRCEAVDLALAPPPGETTRWTGAAHAGPFYFCPAAQGSPCTERRRSSSRSALSPLPWSSVGRPSGASASCGPSAAGRARSRNSQASRSSRRRNLGAGMARSPHERQARTGARSGPRAVFL